MTEVVGVLQDATQTLVKMEPSSWVFFGKLKFFFFIIVFGTFSMLQIFLCHRAFVSFMNSPEFYYLDVKHTFATLPVFIDSLFI